MIELRIGARTLLKISVYVAAYVGLIHLVVDLWAFHNSLIVIWGDFFNDLFTVGIAVTLLLGLCAIVESLPDDEPAHDTPPQNLGEALDRSAFLFRIGMYFVPLMGMAHLVFNILGNRNNAPSEIWAGFFFNAFSVCAVIGFLVAVKAVVDLFVSGGEVGSQEVIEKDHWRGQIEQIISNPLASLLELINIVAFLGLMLTLSQLLAFRNMAPSTVWAAITGNLFLTVTVVGLLVAARTILQGFFERGERAGQSISMGVDRLVGLEKKLNTPSEFLKLAIYAAAYLGALNLVLEVLTLRNASASTMWSFVFINLFFTAAAVSFMIGAKAVADWSIRQREFGKISIVTVRNGVIELFERHIEPKIADGDEARPVQARLSNTLANPRVSLHAGIFVVGVLGIIYTIVDLMSARQGTPFSWYVHFFITNISQVGAGVAILIILVAISDSLRIGNRETDS